MPLKLFEFPENCILFLFVIEGLEVARSARVALTGPVVVDTLLIVIYFEVSLSLLLTDNCNRSFGSLLSVLTN